MTTHAETIAPGIDVLALRTPTLPPATHTNCYLVGTTEITIVDPGSPWDDQRALLVDVIKSRILRGARVVRIVLSHQHHDHVAGAVSLQRSLGRLGPPVPIAAHPITAKGLRGTLHVDVTLHDLEPLTCGDRVLRVLWTPGHAPGHLAFHDEASGVVLVGDLVAAVGTIAIDPSDGDLGAYLSSLQRIQDLGPSVLLPSHGQPIPNATETLERYIAHRHMRSDQICSALAEHEPCGAEPLVSLVYPDLHPLAQPLARAQIESHLIWLRREGRVDGESGAYRLAD